ncbi:MAG: DCC1-like thiol-disulfide oxidoreductase family protein [Verrucomicrobiota bacterium]
MSKEGQRILFYDGECGLCTNSVKFLMGADRARLIHYAPLQGETAREYLPASLREADDLRTVVYQHCDPSGNPVQLLRSGAIAQALRDIGGFWRILGSLLICIPKPIRESGYRFVAKHRLKFFPNGACALPTDERKARLLP